MENPRHEIQYNDAAPGAGRDFGGLFIGCGNFWGIPGGIRGNGTVTVSGVGSELSSIGSIIVGDYGVGVLNITDGAQVSAAELSLVPNSASGYDNGGAFSTTSTNPTKMFIDLSSLNRVVNAPVITATGGITDIPSNSVEFTLNGLALNSIDDRVSGLTEVGVVGNQLLLTTNFNARNEKMTWTGHANGNVRDVWNQTDAKWTNSNNTLNHFLAGDWAVFSDDSSTMLAIEQAVNASRMDVAEGMWNFRDDLPVREDFWVGTPNNEVDGKLHVTGGANVILYGDNIFSGGIEVAGDIHMRLCRA